MDFYIVKPNLQIADCEDCPSDSTLLSKKSAYLSLQKQCRKLSQMNGGDAAVPAWCRCKSPGEPRSPSPADNDKGGRDAGGGQGQGQGHGNPVASLPLQSITLAPQDYSKLEPRPDALSLARLDLPNNISSLDGKWLALKYLQLNSDVALVRYKYLKSYAKITRLLKKYFSKPQVSEYEDYSDSEGFRQINDEMAKFKAFENVLTLLVELKKQFHQRFSHFDAACATPADPDEAPACSKTPSSSR